MLGGTETATRKSHIVTMFSVYFLYRHTRYRGTIERYI